MRLITWLKEQGPAVLAMALIGAVCIPLFLFALADLASGPAASLRSCTPIQHTPLLLRTEPPCTAPPPDVIASRVEEGFSYAGGAR